MIKSNFSSTTSAVIYFPKLFKRTTVLITMFIKRITENVIKNTKVKTQII